ncbi:MAG: UDP-N-acetylglucosamine 2-epimerase (hydrolyzing) [Proteobacteria bacterium]|nr:UDP-N-acetylglucosamine 2-epimerase (hydrolyzing) [Pseudomonadota bacterium]
MRKICYISGTRADFGLMRSMLQAMHRDTDFALSIVVTGMHLAEQYGNTVTEIEAAGLPVTARVAVDMATPSGAGMARNIGIMLGGFVDALESIRPDLVLLLGDRGEMLAGALAAIHLNIPVAHIHGGERSGTVDEPVRHAISKLSHFHFVATEGARERLIRMGELPAHVWVSGAPGLDGIEAAVIADRAELLRDVGFDEKKAVALMVYHPVLQEAAAAGRQAAQILDALKRQGVQVIALKPNADAGSDGVRQVLDARQADPDVRVVTHFPRDRFVSWMAVADLMIGNSSAGIIEAASFGTPVINVGSRQNLRERNANVIDVDTDELAIDEAISRVLKQGRLERHNIYGDGHAGERILALLRQLSLDSSLLAKANAY